MVWVDGAKHGVAVTTVPAQMVGLDSSVPLVQSSYGYNGSEYDGFWSELESDGSNLGVFDEDGLELPRDIVSIDVASRTIERHDLWPAVSGTLPQTLYLQACANTRAISPAQVWLTAGYASVWPLNGDNADRCGLNNLTAVGNLPNTEAGAVGSAQRFDGSSYYNLADTPTYIKNTGSRISFWMQRDSILSNAYPGLLNLRSDGSHGFVAFITVSEGLYRFLAFGSNGTLYERKRIDIDYFGSLAKVSINVQSSVYSVYVNGLEVSIANAPTFATCPQTNEIGTRQGLGTSAAFDGLLDHFTINDGVKSAAWEYREYNNQSTFSTNACFTFEAIKRKSFFINIPFSITTRCQ